MTVLGLPGEALTAVVRKLPDNALAASRQAALQRFLERGFPTTRSEDWKYTDLSDVADIGRRWLEGYAESSPLESLDSQINFKIPSAIVTDVSSPSGMIVNARLEANSAIKAL